MLLIRILTQCSTCRLRSQLGNVSRERDRVLEQAKILGIHLGKITQPLLSAMDQERKPELAVKLRKHEEVLSRCPS